MRMRRLIERNEAALNGVMEELRLSREEHKRTRESTERLFGEFRQFTHDLSSRFERAMRGVERAVDDLSRTVDGVRISAEQLMVTVDDGIDESKSHRAALWQIFDRLGPPDPGGADTAA